MAAIAGRSALRPGTSHASGRGKRAPGYAASPWPDKGGFGIDALWNDDFHHSALVVLSGRSEAYYADYRGTPQELISAVKYGYVFQGQWYRWQKKRRGTPALDLPPTAFVNYLENHDQVANSIRGERCHALSSPGCYRAMTALLLLAPGTPMLFQGQEFASSRPFCYFADVGPEQGPSTLAIAPRFSPNFPVYGPRRYMPILPIPPIHRPSSVASSIFPNDHARGNLRLAPRPHAIATRGPRIRPAAAGRHGWSRPGSRGPGAAVVWKGR